MNHSTDTTNPASTPETTAKPYFPYWYIHGELYDLTPWLEKHPGGADFLQRTRGTDCTAAFEVHHLRMPRAQAMLKQFKVTDKAVTDKIPPSPYPQFDWQQYGELRRRVAQRLAAENWQPGPAWPSILIALSVLLINIAIPLLWAEAGAWQWLLGLVYAMNMIIITGFGHVFLHVNTHWQHLGDLGNFSSHMWKSEHCLAHHLYTNHPDFDPDVTKLMPLLHFNPQCHTRWQPYAPLFVLPLYALAFMALRLTRPLEMLRDRQQLVSRLFWYIVGSFGWLLLWWYVGYLWVGLLLECLASFIFLSLTLSNHNHSRCHPAQPHRDFVTHQLRACYDFGSVNYWHALLFNAFLSSQTLHHLFPTLDPSYYKIVEEELQQMGYVYERHSFWWLYWDHLRFMSRS